jgi:hypothetical protein
MLNSVLTHDANTLIHTQTPCVFPPRHLSAHTPLMLLSPRPWDFPPSIDGALSRTDDPMELDDPEGTVGLD